MMKSLVLVLGTVLICSPAFAYKEGLYSCKNIDGLPDNTYKIRSVSIDGLPSKIPFVEVVRYRRENKDPNSPVVQSRLEGFATVASTSSGLEVLMVAAVQLEFEGDRLVGCKQ